MVSSRGIKRLVKPGYFMDFAGTIAQPTKMVIECQKPEKLVNYLIDNGVAFVFRNKKIIVEYKDLEG